MENRVECLVADSGAFIRNAQLHTIGKKIYSTYEVVDEIRDKATKQRLQVLPYVIIFKEPSPESIKAVTEFTMKTGDYKSLSAVDIKVMSLTYQLHKEKLGINTINNQPIPQKTWTANNKILEKPTEIAGFYLPKNSSTKEVDNESNFAETSEADIKENEDEVVHESTDNLPLEELSLSEKVEEINQVHIDIVDVKQSDKNCLSPVSDGNILSNDMINEDEDSSEEDESENSDDDDNDGWIGPSNIKEVKKEMGIMDDEISKLKVGCLTTDFAMQNVLIQMGLNVISVDGLLIKQAKSYVFRCSACFKITTNMGKTFCPTCGNKTLRKLSMTVNEDGSIQYHMSKKFICNTRGLQYSLPMPKGGKHAWNPKLCEDQREPQNKESRFGRVKYDVFDPNYIVHDSPFAPIDTHSRAACLGIRQNKSSSRRKNPNENNKKGRKK